MRDRWELRSTFTFEGQAVAHDNFGSGEPIVLIHGTPFSSFVWRRIARELGREYRVYVFDLLGYGQSEKREGQDVSLGIQNRIFTALLQHWGLDRPKVVAHDFGGATALRAHLIDCCDYECLLLVDPVAIRPWGSPFVQHVRHHEAAFAGMPDYLQRAALRAYIRGAIYRPISDVELEPFLHPWVGPVGQPAFYRQIAQMDLRYTDEVEPQYDAIRCPVSLVWGMEDSWIPIEQGRALKEMIQGSDLVEVPKAGHLVQEDAPEAILGAAMRLFRRD